MKKQDYGIIYELDCPFSPVRISQPTTINPGGEGQRLTNNQIALLLRVREI